MSLVTLVDIKNVLINTIGGLLGGGALLLLTVGWKGIKEIRKKVERPLVQVLERPTPANIFTDVELGTPAAWIREQLGPPTKIGRRWWGYRFTDSLVSLTFDEDEALETLAVALVDDDSTFHFPAIHFDCPPLGEMMLSDVLQEHLTLEHFESMRHSELVVSGREGPKGAWHYISFGVLWPHYPGPLLEIEFEWDQNANELKTPASWVKVNWASISSLSAPGHFPWDFGLKFS